MTATHVALYKFCHMSNEWMRTEIEGALFVYSRNGEPYHSFMVMNRLNTVNQIEPLVKEFDYQIQSPFLLYRNSKNRIYGIWFYNRDECDNITSLLKSLMTSLREQPSEKTEKRDNVGIFSMLSRAQEDFGRTPVKSESHPPQFSSTPRGPTDVTSQSVMDFFAKASGKTVQKPIAMPVVSNNDRILQRLMSNPAHTVEHIEKQQRSVTPHEITSIRSNDRRSAPVTFPNDSVASFFRAASPQRVSPFLAPPEDPPDMSTTSPLAQPLETSQKPALMPPMMFANFGGNNAGEKLRNVEPLTRNQMLQALNYLLRTDQEFVVKLHEAYVKSFTEVVNRNSTIN